MSFLFDQDVDPQEYVDGFQALIDSGQAWHLEGAIGREAMALIEAGQCMLGEQPHRDYWGNRIPSRYEVEPGTKGSAEYVALRGGLDNAPRL